MKGKIPIWQLRENISGVRIERINEDFISSRFDDISQLHRNDHFICILLTSGAAELLVDFQQMHIDHEKLAFLVPGQIQRAVNFDESSQGWILFLDNKLVDEHARLMIEDSLLKGQLLELSKPDLEWYTRYFDLLFRTYEDTTLGSLHKQAVNAFVAPCVYKIAAAFQANTESLSGLYSQRSIELTRNFKRLIRKHYRELKKPSDYAGQLNISISYLNDTIKAVTGFTTTYFIQQEMLREGQRLLCYTDLSIKEVADYLGYEDDKYFNRVFTKLAGVSPGQFRNIFKSYKR
ncbi:helix-turn-helix domain-containing protein [Flavihumibacter solisilvae]|uniref:helix-turn-helix domain-containing protein n=1 Tax=Flavihumibacter solisilvae TaxID=1349421 RepID=UPI00068F16E2|nr:AraC family transcriptional regulator [Flavihumibacter solisilvae]